MIDRWTTGIADLVRTATTAVRFPVCGYRLELHTGWMVSLAMGVGSYSDNRWDTDDLLADEPEEQAYLVGKWLESSTAELAIFDPEGGWYDHTTGQSVGRSYDGLCVLGYQTPEDVAKIVRRLPDLRPPQRRG